MEEILYFQIVTISLLCLLSLLTVMLNGICIYVINKSKELSKSPSSYLMRNLLSVHFIQGVVVYPIYIAKKASINSLQWKRIVSDGFRFTYMTTFYAAVFSILGIAVDRFIGVRFVMQYKRVMKKRRVVWVTVLLWLYVITLCLLPFKGEKQEKKSDITPQQITNPEVYNYHISSDVPNHYSPPLNSSALRNNITTGLLPRLPCYYIQSNIWTISMLIINCVIPYVLIIFIYQFIGYKIRYIESKTQTDIGMQSKDNHNICTKNQKIQKCKNLTRMSMILSSVYLFCWFPSVIYYIMWSVCPNTCFSKSYKKSEMENYVSFLVKYLAYLDAIASPVIYCFYNKRFRRIIKCLKFDNDEERNFLSITRAAPIQSQP